jgi:hypothetical protein
MSQQFDFHRSETVIFLVMRSVIIFSETLAITYQSTLYPRTPKSIYYSYLLKNSPSFSILEVYIFKFRKIFRLVLTQLPCYFSLTSYPIFLHVVFWRTAKQIRSSVGINLDTSRKRRNSTTDTHGGWWTRRQQNRLTDV